MAKNISEINDGNFEAEVLKSGTPVLVDFWAPWCGPCKALAPTLETLATDYSGKVKFVKVNVDENSRYAAQYGVRSIPTVILFDKGKTLGQLMGNQPRPQIESLLAKSDLSGTVSGNPTDTFVKV